MTEFLTDLGTWAWNPFWVPTLVWSAVALAVMIVIRAIPRVQSQLHLDIRLALLLALPVGILLANIFQPGAGQSGAVFVVPAPDILFAPSVATAASPSVGIGVYTWIGGLTVFALLFTVVGLTRLGTGFISLRNIIRASSPLDTEGSISDDEGMTIDILECSQIRVAFSCGLLRRRIVIPSEIGDEARLILLHELQHHRDGDIWRAWFGQLVTALFFFHPFVHVFRRETELLVELSCDQQMLSRSEIDRVEYAGLLLKYSGQGVVRAGPALFISDTPSHLKQRIRALKQPLGRVLRGRTVIVVALLFLGIGSFAAACSMSEMMPTESDIPDDDALGLVMGQPESALTETFIIVDQMPKLIGGLDGLQASLRYPEIALKAGVKGRVFLQFVVKPDGSVSDIVVTRGIGAGCDREAIRAVSELRFIPGMQGTERVSVKMSLPVTFNPHSSITDYTELRQLVDEKEYMYSSTNWDIVADARIRGRVLDSDGTPLQRVFVSMQFHGVRTDLTGSFELTLPHGTWTLQVYIDRENEWDVEVTITEGEVKEMDLRDPR